ncbi:twin-arginine translocation pathway signal protein [Halochromatium salexigens]|uniref:Thiol:disulfide interchange protein n=2 Tax=Halochromatium salexigens TaxID=49447 RepID=A0AAJ0UHE0_HALSE|nr:thiol:disulfide interchange protein DsbA/DsbL [Halochromatium salexigens]MBK5931527.1 twin-arginine translocation pathway signal protein [Halochromatium salexigens]
MKMMQRRFSVCLLAAMAFLLCPFVASADLVEGRDWRALSGSAQDTPEGAEIEVLELFSYGCPHCADINPLAKQWADDLPSDVRFERVPVTFGRAAWESLARLYFALDFADELDQVDQAVFEAVTKQRTNLYTEKAVLNWVAEQGLDRDAFAKVYNSFAVEAALAKANTLAARYRVDAVPMFIVDGRYVVLNEGAKTHAELLEIAEGLIDKARQARQGQARQD